VTNYSGVDLVEVNEYAFRALDLESIDNKLSGFVK
jgi:hypothetical protein